MDLITLRAVTALEGIIGFGYTGGLVSAAARPHPGRSIGRHGPAGCLVERAVNLASAQSGLPSYVAAGHVSCLAGDGAALGKGITPIASHDLGHGHTESLVQSPASLVAALLSLRLALLSARAEVGSTSRPHTSADVQ